MKFLYKLFRLEEPSCKTCEALREQIAMLTNQLEVANFEKREILNKTVFKSAEVPEKIDEKELKPIYPRFLPTSVRREMLERESREEAKLLAMKAKEEKEQSSISVEDLEEELLIVARDNSSASGGQTFNSDSESPDKSSEIDRQLFKSEKVS